jgi:hypothetical protein
MRLINDEVGDPNILCRCDTRPNDEDAVLHGGRQSIAKLTCCRDACTTFAVTRNARSRGEADPLDLRTGIETLSIHACARTALDP